VIGWRVWPTSRQKREFWRASTGWRWETSVTRNRFGGGISELRIDWGPGYRVYYALVGRTCVLLLCGGDKRKQSTDIQRAIEYLRDYHERTQSK